MLHTIFPNGEWHYLLGGLLVGAGVSVLFVLTGLVGGASTVFSSSWSYVIKRPFFNRRGSWTVATGGSSTRPG